MREQEDKYEKQDPSQSMQPITPKRSKGSHRKKPKAALYVIIACVMAIYMLIQFLTDNALPTGTFTGAFIGVIIGYIMYVGIYGVWPD